MEVLDGTQTGRGKNINADLYTCLTPHTALVTSALPLTALGWSRTYANAGERFRIIIRRKDAQHRRPMDNRISHKVIAKL